MQRTIAGTHSFSKRVLLGIPAAIALASVATVTEAATLTTPNNIQSTRTSFNPPTWRIPLNRNANTGRGAFNFDVFHSNPNGWRFIVEQTNNKGRINLSLLDDFNTGGNEPNTIFAFTTASKRFDSERTSYRVIFGGSPSQHVKNGKFRINPRNGARGWLTAKAIPEPFSTAAAGLLAIAGIGRTLKRKRSSKNHANHH